MRHSGRSNRRAYILAETSVAAVLLAVALVATIKLLSWTASERRATERRGWAAQEAANTMEALTALPFDRLSQETAGQTARLSKAAQKVLPEGRMQVQIHDETDLPMKRIALAVTWTGASGLSDGPVKLTAWVARKGAKP